METVQLCPPEILSALARLGPALEQVFDVPPATLGLAREAAEVVGALSGDLELASAVLAQSALGRPGVTPEALSALAGAGPARIATDLGELGELRLPSDWSPAHGLVGRQAQSARKMLLAVASDPRLVLARLATELVRLRHAGALAAEERERLARAARDIFAPLASRLGVWQLKWELEDLAFRCLQPEGYRRIAAALQERRADRERYLEAFCALLRTELEAAGVHAEVYGRPKHIDSIHRKMQRKQLPFERIFDIRAVRILVDSVSACYAALGVVHGRWSYLPSEFDDYIATPKDNLYRSIHTAIIGPEGRIVEVQIRTREMHEHAELGVAAHWQYKEGGARDRSEARKIEAVRRLLRPAAEGPERDGLEGLREQLFADHVYALTPKGDVVELPRGATPLDLAYRVHSGLGHRCRGAKVNGRIAPLTQPLRNGDVVEIIAGKQAAPSRDWLSPELGYLASARSRSKVRAWLRREASPEAHGASPEAREASPTAGVQEIDRASLPLGRRPRRAPTPGTSPVRIMGMGDLPVTIARCCAPVRPQPIEAYVTAGRGVTIHSRDCRSLARMRASRPHRILEAEWTEDDESQASR